MKLISRLRGRCFCAFCKSERKVYVKKHVDLTNVVGAIFLSLAAGQAYWGTPDPRALVLFCVTILVLEVFVYMRWRASLVCPLCGFDPLIYKKSPEKAAQMVRAFYNEQGTRPAFMLSRSPLLINKRKKLQQERKSGEYKAMEAKILARKVGRNASSLIPTKSP